MATGLGVTAGVVRFDGVTGADWQASDASLSGDWGSAAHWTTASVPDGATPVVISDNDTATAGWLVTETSEAAASLLLDMHLGTLEAAGSLAVSGTLTQTQGLLLADASAEISVGAFAQAGGIVLLNDDGTGRTTLESTGTDTVNGTIGLGGAAVWTDLALGIGTGVVDDASPVTASVTLVGGTGDGSLYVAGVLQVGGDPGGAGIGGGGVGSLEIDGGSNADVGGLILENGSAISVDAGSYMRVGSAATVQVGALNIGADGAATVDIGTVNADIVNAGSLAIVAFQGTGGAQPGELLIAGSLLTTGSVSLASGATLVVGGSIEIDLGGLAAGSGAVLSVGNDTDLGSGGLYLAGGQLMLNDATLLSQGRTDSDSVNSDATLLDGAQWFSNTLSIAPGFSDGTTAEAAVTLAGGSALTDAGGLDIGNDPGVGSDVTFEPGGFGTLALTGASTVTANSLAILNLSTLTLDGTSSMVLGTATAEQGTVAVGADSLIFADIATIVAGADDAGTLQVAGTPGGSAGSLLITGSLTGAGAVTLDGMLEVGSASQFAGSIDIGSGGTLILDAGDMAHAVAAADSATATIEVLGQAFNSSAFTPVYDTNTGLLVFGDGAGQSTLDVGAGHALGDLSLFADGSGTLITEAPCYVAGTLIRGEAQAAPVEVLRPGDLVRTWSGRLAPVRWVGWRTINLLRHPQPWRAAPVRVRAGALAPGVPSRDLLVSPEHALFVEGRLVPAFRLANGATIAREDGLASVSYVHVELDRHDILLAEDCPAESYLDTGNRGLFANSAGPHPLHPVLSGTPDPAALAVWAAQAAAPLLLDGEALAAIRAAILARARRLGWVASAEPRPEVVADDTPLVVRPAGARAWRVRLHPDATRLHLRSASFVPAELLADSGDTRRLGLPVRTLLVAGEALPAAAYGGGWHPPEGGFRWTDGSAEILLPRRSGRATLELAAEPVGQYWHPPRRRLPRQAVCNAATPGAAQLFDQPL